MSHIKDKIRITFSKLLDHSQISKTEISDIEFVKAEGYKKDNTFPKEGWEPFAPGTRITGNDDHYWFRAKIKTPAAANNRLYMLRTITTREGEWNHTSQQGLIYLNGEMISGYDPNHTDVFLEPDKEYEIHDYMAVDRWNQVTFRMMLVAINTKIEQLYYDMLVPYEACLLLDENSTEYISMMSVLEQTANIIDLREPYSQEYYDSIEKATQFINDELYEKLCSREGKPVVACIGHTHIDVEWQWARRQTREKMQRSYSTASMLMNKYPEYIFTLTQPELYRYLKEEAPEKYEELKQFVKDGRWEPEGSMWVESDCNLVSGESFIRQIMHGKRFFKNEFGKDCVTLFLPDVFGYSCALPQILKKCGIRHFVTSKISWNDTNTIPYDTFMWKGLDGTEIFTNFITAQDYVKGQPPRYTTYVGKLNATQIKGAWHRYSQKEYCNRAMTTYGFGDGGGGPTKLMLETQRRLSKGLPGMPVTEMSFLVPHLDKVRAEFDKGCEKTGRIPKWVGELYLEFHRGTYTSVAKNKRNNRKSEFALSKAEALSVTANLFGGKTYETDTFDWCWRKVLHNQFHDIIPGSSVHSVYEGTDKDYAEIFSKCNSVVNENLKFISENLSTKGGVMVYNPLGFKRKGVVKLDGKVCELKQEAPAFGWMVADGFITDNDININGLTAENRYYIMTLDKAGRISRLYDKENAREIFCNGTVGNELQAFEDYPREYDNWEITEYYKSKKYVLDDDAVIEPFIDGSSAGFKVVKKYMKSEIVQYIRLYTENRRIDFETEIDWYQKHQLLKAAFPLDINTTSATYEVQFGHVARPTHENTSWDQAKFEVYGHKWVDMADNNYGVAMLNDCKYGYNTEGTTLKLTMLKCGAFPDPQADVGHHIFVYSLLPHKGDFRSAGVIHEAYSLNQPLECVPVSANSGKLAENYSLVSCDSDNIIVETVKKAENDDAVIVRLYDAFNQRTNAKINISGDFKKAFLCDMLENEIEELKVNGNEVSVPVGNFEVVTLKFKA